MRRFYLFIVCGTILFSSLLFIAGTSHAQSADEQAQPAPTRIEADPETNEIRFYIDGDVAAVLKKDGLHVRKSIAYGGTLTDYGEQGFEKFTGHAKPAPDAGKDGEDAQ